MIGTWVDSLFGQSGPDALGIEAPQRAVVNVGKPEGVDADLDGTAAGAPELLHHLFLLGLWLDAGQGETVERDPHGPETDGDSACGAGHAEIDALAHLVDLRVDPVDLAVFLA